MEKIINRVYTLGGILLLISVVMALSSCGSSKQFHIGTGEELSKSKCSGRYINK